MSISSIQLALMSGNKNVQTAAYCFYFTVE